MPETTTDEKPASSKAISQQRLVRIVRQAQKAYGHQSAGFDFHLFDPKEPPSTVEEALDIVRGERHWHELHSIEVERCLDEWVRKIEDLDANPE